MKYLSIPGTIKFLLIEDKVLLSLKQIAQLERLSIQTIHYHLKNNCFNSYFKVFSNRYHVLFVGDIHLFIPDLENRYAIDRDFVTLRALLE